MLINGGMCPHLMVGWSGSTLNPYSWERQALQHRPLLPAVSNAPSCKCRVPHDWNVNSIQRSNGANGGRDGDDESSWSLSFSTESVSAFHVPAFQRNHNKKAGTFFSGTLAVQLGALNLWELMLPSPIDWFTQSSPCDSSLCHALSSLLVISI